jgi:hypothetical protein
MRLAHARERRLITQVVLHTLIIGPAFIAAPDWTVRFGGWQKDLRPMFFGRRVGIFHVVPACGYLIEYLQYRGVLLIVTATSLALVVLLLATFLGDLPWAVPLCGVADGIMALAVWFVHRAAGAP